MRGFQSHKWAAIRAFADPAASVRLDEALRGAVGWVNEVDVFGRAARRIDGEHGEGMVEDARQSVDGVFSEEDKFAGPYLACGRIGDDDLGAAGEDVEVLVAAGVEVCGDGTVDAEDAAAGGLLVGEAEIGEHGFSGCGESCGEFGDVEDAAFGWHVGWMWMQGARFRSEMLLVGLSF